MTTHIAGLHVIPLDYAGLRRDYAGLVRGTMPMSGPWSTTSLRATHDTHGTPRHHDAIHRGRWGAGQHAGWAAWEPAYAGAACPLFGASRNTLAGRHNSQLEHCTSVCTPPLCGRSGWPSYMFYGGRPFHIVGAYVHVLCLAQLGEVVFRFIGRAALLQI